MSIKNGNFVKIIAALISLSIILGLLPLSSIHATADNLYVKDFSYTIDKTDADPSNFHIASSSTDTMHIPHWIGDPGFTDSYSTNSEKINALDGVVLFSDTAKAYDFGIGTDNDYWAGSIATNINYIEASFVLSDGSTKPVKIDFKNTDSKWKMYLEIQDKNDKFATFKVDEVKIPSTPNAEARNILTLIGGSVTDEMIIGILDSSRSYEPTLRNDRTIGGKTYVAGSKGVSAGKGTEWDDSYLDNLNKYTTYFVTDINVEGVGPQTVILKLDVVIDINCAGCLTYNVSDCILANTYRIDIDETSKYYDPTMATTVTCNLTGDFSDSKVINLDSNGAGTASTMLKLDPAKNSYSVTLKETPIENVVTTPSDGYTISLQSKDIIKGVSDYKLWTATVNGVAYDNHMTAEFLNTYPIIDISDATISSSNRPVYSGEPIDLDEFSFSTDLDGMELPSNVVKYHFYSDIECNNEVLDSSNNPSVPTDAGVYYVKAEGVEAEGYTGVTSAVLVRVNKASVLKPEVNSKKFVYDGAEKELEINLYGADPTLFNIVGNKGTDVGSYSAYVALADTKNYCWIGDDASSSNASKPIIIDWTINEPSKPDNNDVEENNVKPETVADTGDYANSALWSLIMIGSFTASSALYIRRRKV